MMRYKSSIITNTFIYITMLFSSLFCAKGFRFQEVRSNVTVFVPEISLRLGVNPLTTNSSTIDFGRRIIRSANATTPSHTVVLENFGSADLLLTNNPPVFLDSKNNNISCPSTSSSFCIFQPQNILTTIGESKFTSFVIRFIPQNSTGDFLSTISIANNDSDENPFIFFLKGISSGSTPEAEINIRVNEKNYLSMASTYDFGSFALGQTSSNVIFTIENEGDKTLNLTASPKVALASSNSNNFILNEGVTATTVSSDNTTTFILQFKPTATGAELPFLPLTRTATITVASNDSNEPLYTITVKGIIAQ